LRQSGLHSKTLPQKRKREVRGSQGSPPLCLIAHNTHTYTQGLFPNCFSIHTACGLGTAHAYKGSSSGYVGAHPVQWHTIIAQSILCTRDPDCSPVPVMMSPAMLVNHFFFPLPCSPLITLPASEPGIQSLPHSLPPCSHGRESHAAV
jgi:hypothetical protein